MLAVLIITAMLATYCDAFDPRGNYFSASGYGERGFSFNALQFSFLLKVLPALFPCLYLAITKKPDVYFYLSWVIAFGWALLWLVLYLID